MLIQAQYEATAKRLEELAYMMRRTAIDPRISEQGRIDELDRLHHRARQRLDECAALSEMTVADRIAV